MIFSFLVMCLLPALSPAQSADVWVAASAHVAGGFNSNWRTDVWVYNGGTAQADISIYFLQTGADKSAENLARPPVAATIPAGNQKAFGDILKTTFSLDSASGSLYFSSSQPVKVVSRTYNKLEAGEYGQFIGGQPGTSALSQARLVGATGTSTFRTNMGFANPSRTATASVTLTFLSRSGSTVKTEALTLAPFVQIQINDIFAFYGISSQENMTVAYVSDTPVLGYLSIVDNATNDPIFVPGLP
jgi:hypothetical protein